ARIVAQTSSWFGSRAFVSHAYAAQAHQSVASSRRAWSSPLQVGLCDSTVVTCVNPKTKTRSKKSSSGVTRCSRSDRRVLTHAFSTSQGPPRKDGRRNQRRGDETCPTANCASHIPTSSM